ncbi:uncharacterized protein LOC109861881 isoform X2 [Pseudomyrmex gracilis]|uniref:uncharacterized protein LOC109861881 isoform X2 n=1 Tax=Pseudomyrmex gracilis TaxID=219809 RepID=UPI00099503A7|nr:uncharacterized protein LOC109861881 isoform X2 [Pseudomyrmex gracilis]
MFRKTLSLLSSLKSKHVASAAYCSVLNDSSRVCSEEIKHVNTEQTKVGKTKSKKARKKINSVNDKETLDIIEYIQKVNPDMAHMCSKELTDICRTKDARTLYLIDRETAVNYVSLIKNDLLKNTCFVAEMNPGFGILTTELLKTGVPLIHLYETNKELYHLLDIIRNNYPNRLDLKHLNLAKIVQILYIDKITGANKMEEILQDIEYKNWEDKNSMQVIGTIKSEKFFNQLIKSLLYRNCLMTHGRPVFYIGVSPSIWHMKLDYENIYVIKLEPKVDLYSHLSQEDWITFSYFAKHHLQKRSSRVIPELEKWIPGCGIRLIAKDYTIFTQFGELTPVQIMELFKEFKSWPEYKDSYFLTSMQDSLSVHNELDFLEINNLKAD